MSTDDELGRLLHDAVADVEPTDRLGELRARTATTRGTGLRWGAALAAAAVVAIVAGVVATTGPDVAREPVATGPSRTPSPTADAGRAVAAYFVGETPRGPRLYREFQRVASPTPGLSGLELLESGPVDPDYTTEWPAGSFRLDRISDPEDGTVHVWLSQGAPSPSELAMQQVVHTVSAGFGEPLTVVFHRGAEQSEPVAALPQLEVLALVNLSDPSEGQMVGDVLAVEGRASSFEANVPWRIEGTDLSGSFTAEGWTGARLFPFSGDVDVSSLDPGTYTLIVETDDPSGGAEGPGATSDSRTVVVP
ncbi:hypothetical protein GCM10009623_33830 [Nocardioides aestuarii]|uniref:Gmad2 immunoglobulin-like domain-containing protein n=1 Tax=Nocardioides aestuarii TaxID=252231 RepID=A0ABW4TPE7_9ACTN